MDIAMIGLGKMGANMAARLLRGGHHVVAYDVNEKAIQAAEKEGMQGARTLDEVVKALKAPRSVWVMVPSGKITDDTIQSLSEKLERGDTVIDGGNSNYKDTIRHAELLSAKGIEMLDCGTSGGIWGLKEGYGMMVGGSAEVVDRHRSVFDTLAPGKDKGWGHVGPNGAGHFVKMVHNGIEYGLMQAYAEGFEIMKSKKEFELDLHQIAEIWRFGTVIRSWLLDLTALALEKDPTLSDIQPWVADSGEGRWTAFEAIDLNVPAPVITLALQMRLASRDEENYSARLLAAMRNEFGGHAVKHEE